LARLEGSKSDYGNNEGSLDSASNADTTFVPRLTAALSAVRCRKCKAIMIDIPSVPTVPVPRCPVMVRAAIANDLPFIDSLQKQHAKQVGWMPAKQLEGKVGMGHVLVAERVKARSQRSEVRGQQMHRRLLL
jgi:hypothetical protein